MKVPEPGRRPAVPPPAHRLAEFLAGLTQPAVFVGRDRVIRACNAAYIARFSPDAPVEGRPCYVVSHGSPRRCDEQGASCPVTRCERTGEPARMLHVHHTPEGPVHEEVSAYPIREEDGTVAGFLEILNCWTDRDCKAHDGRPQLAGSSHAWRRLLDLSARVAATDASILILGESGSGKEVIARCVHRMSRRADRPFVPVDCSGLTETLFESELFGHEKGAFTGASSRTDGLVEAADGGTLFLDEIGDVPLGMQVKLLRLLETRTFRRVGSTELRRSDFRLVCATHRDPREMVAAGTFRHDLYFRIAAFPIRIPPLRDRKEDLPDLVAHFEGTFTCCRSLRLSGDAWAALRAYDFPGNVRELRNVLEHACLLADGATVHAEHLPDEVAGCAARAAAVPPAAGALIPLSDMERTYLRRACDTFDGDRKELARRLGLSERTLYRKLRDARRDS